MTSSPSATHDSSTSRNDAALPSAALAPYYLKDGDIVDATGRRVSIPQPALVDMLNELANLRLSALSESVPKWKEWGDFDTLPKHGSVIASGFDPDGNSWIEIVSAQWLRNGAPMDFATHWMPLPVAPHRQGAK